MSDDQPEYSKPVIRCKACGTLYFAPIDIRVGMLVKMTDVKVNCLRCNTVNQLASGIYTSALGEVAELVRTADDPIATVRQVLEELQAFQENRISDRVNISTSAARLLSGAEKAKVFALVLVLQLALLYLIKTREEKTSEKSAPSIIQNIVNFNNDARGTVSTQVQEPDGRITRQQRRAEERQNRKRRQ